MKCYKCGKEAPLKNGLCPDCYKELIEKKNQKKQRYNLYKSNYIFSSLDTNEIIVNKIKTSDLIYLFLFLLLGSAAILFPKTITEFFVRDNRTYFTLLVFNIAIFFLGIYTIVYFTSREIYLTNKRIIAKWGIFKVQTLNTKLNNIKSIDSVDLKGLEITTSEKTYNFDFVANSEQFRFDTIEQVKGLIHLTNSEKVLMSFSHSLNDKIKVYQLEKENPNMTICKCCKKEISKESIYCVHCGHPVEENERSIDLFTRILCFLLFPIGVILYLINAGPYPKFAKQCLFMATFSIFFILLTTLSYLSIMV